MEAKMVGKEGRTGAADFSGGICYVCSRSNAVPVAAAKVGVAGPPLPSSSISNAAIILRIDLKGLRVGRFETECSGLSKVKYFQFRHKAAAATQLVDAGIKQTIKHSTNFTDADARLACTAICRSPPSAPVNSFAKVVLAKHLPVHQHFRCPPWQTSHHLGSQQLTSSLGDMISHCCQVKSIQA
jgi:hypothetical protein